MDDIEQPPGPKGVKTTGVAAAPYAGLPGYHVSLRLSRVDPVAVTEVTERWMRRRIEEDGVAESETYTRRVIGEVPRTLTMTRETADVKEHVSVTLHHERVSRASWVVVQRCIRAAWIRDEDLPLGLERSTYLPPAIVPLLIRTFGAERDRHVLLLPRVCDESDAVRLAEYVECPKRTMPVVVVSSGNSGSGALAGAGTLARQVAGQAHVFSLADSFAALRFGEAIGEGFECAGGAARLFWPGMSRIDPVSDHPAWDPHVRYHERESFELDVLAKLSEWWREREKREDGR